MGQFALIISGTGNHGCSREVKDGESVLGCQRPDCVDCIAREVVRRFKRNSVVGLEAELIHWPATPASVEAMKRPDSPTGGECTIEPYVAADFAIVFPQGSSVIDDLVTGIRRGSF
jgi:hypothetical protein